MPALLLLAAGEFCFPARRVDAGRARNCETFPTFPKSFVGLFYKLSLFHFVAGLIASVFFLVRTWVQAKSAVVRQQLKWVIWGSVLAVAPFTLLYARRIFVGCTNDPWLTDAAVLPLILIPLAFGYSVVRYRLMDVELVVRRVFVYVLTTLAIALMVGVGRLSRRALRAGRRRDSRSGEITLRVVIAIVAMAAIVMIAAPVKNFLQEHIDRLFYGERYDMRHSLLDFGRTLSATTALDPLLDSLVSRLQQVMNVGRIAIFIEDKTATCRLSRGARRGTIFGNGCAARLSRDDPHSLSRNRRSPHATISI